MTKPTAAEIPNSSWLFFENIFMTQFPQKSFAIKSRTFWIFDNLHISNIAILIFIRWGWVGQMDLTELSCNIETIHKKSMFYLNLAATRHSACNILDLKIHLGVFFKMSLTHSTLLLSHLPTADFFLMPLWLHILESHTLPFGFSCEKSCKWKLGKILVGTKKGFCQKKGYF